MQIALEYAHGSKGDKKHKKAMRDDGWYVSNNTKASVTRSLHCGSPKDAPTTIVGTKKLSTS